MADELTAYDEAVRDDCYRLKTVSFAPTTFYDLGAHKGHMSAFVASLWPTCNVIAVEPDMDNMAAMMIETKAISTVTPVLAAIGHGCVQRTAGLNSLTHRFDNDDGEAWHGQVMTLAEVCALFSPQGEYIVKFDIEGAERTLLDDHDSMEVLCNAAYWAGEFHFKLINYAQALLWLHKMALTHALEIQLRRDNGRDGALVWAMRHKR